jgi:hypothetical protein
MTGHEGLTTGKVTAMSDLETAEVPDRQLVSRCGCIGLFAYEYVRPAVIAIVIQVPCPAGHPTRVRPGVIERFLPNLLSPYQPAT